MKVILPPPLKAAPPDRSSWQDFRLLLATQIKVSWNNIRHWPVGAWIGISLLGIGFLSLLVYLGVEAYGALAKMPPDIARGFLSLLFMMGLVGQIFFGITAAFATLYMADDLEILFMAPVPTRVVFAVKSLVVAGSNFIVALLFAFLPGLFYGLLFQAGAAHYLIVLLVGFGIWAIATALAELLNLVVMRIVPPHRSREAVGLIGAVASLLIALVFQIPNLVIVSGESFNIASWLSGQQELLRVMDYFPWGWGAMAIAKGSAGQLLSSLGWSLLLLSLGAVLFMGAFLLVERGFRRGWISLSQGEGGRRQKKRPHTAPARRLQGEKALLLSLSRAEPGSASPWRGMWAVAVKDLLYMRRDTREWFGYLLPIILMAYFVGQFIFFPSDATSAPLVMVLVMYSIMFSGNIALQSFGREGESDWLLNSVPLSGWPVVWGKLLGAVLPTLVLMEVMLMGTALAVNLSATVVLGMAVGAVLLTLGASAIGLYYSINSCRYNPDSPQQRISPGASMLMYIVNLLFMAVLALGIVYIFPPDELVSLLDKMPPVTFEWSFLGVISYLAFVLSRPLMWQPVLRVVIGIAVTGGVWMAVFFGFMSLTVRQSRKGFRVEIVTGSKKSGWGRLFGK